MPLLYLSPIHKASRQIGLYFESAMGESGVAPFEGHLLTYLRAYAPCALSEIHRVFGTKRSTLTSVFDRLEERGLLVRETLAQDRRSFLVRLTRKGTAAANRVQLCVEALESSISKGISKNDLEGFRRVMSSIETATQTNPRARSPRASQISPTGETTMNSKALAVQFQFTHLVFKRNVQDVSHEESMTLPQPGGNCLNWVAGHITATRDHLLGLLGDEPVWTSENKKKYVRGSAPWTNGQDAERLETILERFDESQKRLVAKIHNLDEFALSAPVPQDKNAFGVDNMGELLATFAFHESYHVGQTGILRRWLGKEGAIK